MIQKIKKFIVLSIASVSLLAPGLVVAGVGGVVASAAIDSSLCAGSTAASGEDCNTSTGLDANTSGLTGLATRIVDIFSIIIGAIAIIFLLYGGFRYITSGGDSGRVGNAKNTILYAIIGLIIVALAQVIVNLVLGAANQAGADLTS
jgi:hypothetical protein